MAAGLDLLDTEAVPKGVTTCGSGDRGRAYLAIFVSARAAPAPAAAGQGAPHRAHYRGSSFLAGSSLWRESAVRRRLQSDRETGLSYAPLTNSRRKRDCGASVNRGKAYGSRARDDQVSHATY